MEQYSYPLGKWEILSGQFGGSFTRLIRTARTRLDLSQAEFARRFHVPLGTLRDWEQARTTAPDFAVAYVRVIMRDPDMVAAAVA